jgi:hypothetical protein
VIGLAAGQFFDIRHALSPIATPQPTQSARLATPPPLSRASVVPVSDSSVSDEALFFGADPAQTTERLSMLRSIDDITPRARDLERPR